MNYNDNIETMGQYRSTSRSMICVVFRAGPYAFSSFVSWTHWVFGVPAGRWGVAHDVSFFRMQAARTGACWRVLGKATHVHVAWWTSGGLYRPKIERRRGFRQPC